MKKKKPAKALRGVPAILNDIHEGYPVTMPEALRVIAHLEDQIAKLQAKAPTPLEDKAKLLRQFVEQWEQRQPKPEPLPMPEIIQVPIYVPYYPPLYHPIEITCTGNTEGS